MLPKETNPKTLFLGIARLSELEEHSQRLNEKRQRMRLKLQGVLDDGESRAVESKTRPRKLPIHTE